MAGSVTILATDNIGEADLGSDATPSAKVAKPGEPRGGSLGIGQVHKVSKETADRLVLMNKARILSASEAKAEEDKRAAARLSAAPPLPAGVEPGSKEAEAHLERSRVATGAMPPSADAPDIKEALSDSAEAKAEVDENAAEASARADAEQVALRTAVSTRPAPAPKPAKAAKDSEK